MSPENKEYVVVNEKEFGNKETLKGNNELLTRNNNKLLTGAINTRIESLNKKLDTNYSTRFLEEGKNTIDNKKQAELATQLKEITQGFNNKLDEIVKKYKGAIDENMIEIIGIIDKFFVEEIQNTLKEQPKTDNKDTSISGILKKNPVMGGQGASKETLEAAGML